MADRSRVRVSAVVISFNTCTTTMKCLESLLPEIDRTGGEVIVVDNASTDGTVTAIETNFSRVRVIVNHSNIGFGRANNVAADVARGDYLLLVNSDAFVHCGGLERMLDLIESDSTIAAVGPKLVNEDASLQRSAYLFPTPLQTWLEALSVSRVLARCGVREDYECWPHDRQADVPWLIGACLLVRRDCYQKLGGFDPRFFLYAEETDFQRRLTDMGWRVVFTPHAVVTHVGGNSGATQPVRTRELFFQSKDRYLRKHFGYSGFASVVAATCVASVLRAMFWGAVAAGTRADPASRARRKLDLNLWLARRYFTALPWRVSAEPE